MSAGPDTKPNNPPPSAEVEAAFVACPRCAYFLAGYKLIYPDYERAVKSSGREGWLRLRWDQQVAELLERSYGAPVDIACLRFETLCPACQRPFAYLRRNGSGAAAEERLYARLLPAG
ncbi:MAG: hypothetical protein ACRDHL_01085 [Candidatus Promineifilaceae bacterium]